MKKLFLFVMALPFILLLTQFTCDDEIVKEYPTETKAYFWTNDESVASQRIYIDDLYSGTVPYIDDKLKGPGNKMVEEKGLLVPVKPGRYKIRIIDTNENTVCRGELSLKFGRNIKISSSWNNNKCHVYVAYRD